MPAKKGDIYRSKTGKRSPRRRAGEKEFESLVAAGVRKFVLEDATIKEFVVALRSAARKNVIPPHELSAKVLSRIVRESMKKRKKIRKR